MNLKDFLEDCKNEEIIDQETAGRVYAHYLKRVEQQSNQNRTIQNNSGNSLIITVSIIGVVLIGFGIIYLFAHNWDNLSRFTKTVLSLLPVVISILVNVFTLTKRKDNVVWQESAAVYSFLAVGSMLALILQVYQLPGIENYFFTYWCVLCLPMVYILKSHCAVFCALILMLLNLTSYPMDQSSLIRIPWFGSLLMFSALVPYYKRLFTLRKPDSLYITHQVLIPLVICLTAVVSMKGAHSSIWLILFLILANFQLFGTSIFMRSSDRKPNLISILSYAGLSLTLSYLLFYPDWGFDTILKVDGNDHRLFFIPLLLVAGLIQLILYFRKEKVGINNMYKFLILLPLPFVLMNFFGAVVLNYYVGVLFIVAAMVIYFAQQRKDEWQLYPALGMISVIIVSLTYHVDSVMSFFLISLLPSLYYLIPAPMKIEEQSKNKLEADHVAILSLQFTILLIASFSSFWSMYGHGTHKQMTAFEIGLTLAVILGTVLITLKERSKLLSHMNGILTGTSILVPLLVFIGCVSSQGMQHMYSIVLLVSGIITLIYSAKKSNLTVANLALGMIGVVMACRFFDLKMSLTVKGILFILIGVSFFFANYLILKNRKNEKV